MTKRGRVENLQRDGKPVAGARAGNTRALTHGAHSEPAVKRTATNQKRALLRRIGLRQADLDGVGLALLDNWARAASKVRQMDDYFDRVGGVLDGRGKPRGATAFYLACLNAERRAVESFAKHLKDRGHGDRYAGLAEFMIEDAEEVTE
jgi:hypothetical protein